MSSIKRVSSIVQSEQTLADNLPTAMPTAVFLVGDQSLTSEQVVTGYKTHISHEAQLVTVRAQLRILTTAIKAERKLMAATTLVVRATAATSLGQNSTGFASLGFEPRTAKKPTPAVKTAAIAKGEATRVARHTTGPKEKLKIHGTVPEPAPAPSPVTPSVATK
jgi:hypothetical protein